MEAKIDARHKLYEDFLKEFPLESLKDMPLERYTNLNKSDSFCYWLEFKTLALGSMKGGDSGKFGIYRYNKLPKNIGVVDVDDAYAWYNRFNVSTREMAYNIVLGFVEKIATAAFEGDFDLIDEDKTLGEVYKWKIAFLYSNKSLIPIYKRSKLEECAAKLGYDNPNGATICDLQKFLMSQKGDRDLFEYYDYLWSLTLDNEVGKVKYWLYAPGEGARFWDECAANGKMYLGWDDMGDLSQYDSKEAMAKKMSELYGGTSNFMNDSLATFEFVHTLKPGDIVYAKKGKQQILGRGIVKGAYEYDDNRKEYKNVRTIEWQDIGEWAFDERILVTKTLTDITKYPEFVKEIQSLVDGVDTETTTTTYTKEEFLNEVYISESEYDKLKGVLEHKKNIILQGAPGVGKTWSARRLAYSIMGERDDERIGFVQFHQNYSYEDFVMGYKPNSDGGFDLQRGIFYKFCIKAANDPDRKYFFIIDEINRGNLSKIFGELLMLIEKDYRFNYKEGKGTRITLAYNNERFAVPENLYIIGMMNTADRSLAMIDYALRRRFSFYPMAPGFDSDGFKYYQETLDNDKFNLLIDKVKELNKDIVADGSLGLGFEIGHSYFCNQEAVTDVWLRSVVNYEIVPMLEEYWFDNRDKVDEWSAKLRESIK